MPVKNYSEENSGEVLSSSAKSLRNKVVSVKNKSKKKSVTTMQDDLAVLVSKKNQPLRAVADKKINDLESNNDMQSKLTEVYTDGDGGIPDLTKLDKNERPLWKTIIYSLIGVFSVLLIVAILGFWIFSKLETNNFTNERINLKIETPITIVSGQEGIYTITITNKEKVNLYNLELELFYPDNFEYLDSLPKASGNKNNKWSFSVLNIGESQKIELRGKMIASIKSNQTIRGI